ncbi:MAG TPA: reverse transcriptase/maturase family protein [bacterium]|jgi:retron-type reverse transcriptase|nr:reverse transcriptase/maturase family protein [bacterium]HPX64922.1 reverse transcriptase/maturase family protein [bacterium]
MHLNSHLYSQVIAWDNLYLAYKEAAKGRRYRPEILQFTANLEENLYHLQASLAKSEYSFGPYRQKMIYEPKQRLISIAPFTDRIVHHAICQVIEPIFDRRFIYDSYACRRGHGNKMAVQRLDSWLFHFRPTWILQGDIYHYFAMIDHDILLTEIKRVIGDQQLLDLLSLVISSYWADNLNKGRGLPIGNLTSQLFANIYLNRFDHFIKRELGPKLYLRYMDDFIILSNDKHNLRQVWLAAADFLSQNFCLTFHPNKTHIIKSQNGLTFLGYRHFFDYHRPKNKTYHRFSRRFKSLAQQSLGDINYFSWHQLILAWRNYARGANCYVMTGHLLNYFE